MVDSFTLSPGRTELRRIKLTSRPASVGGADTIEMTISVDKTFVPATVPALKSNDPANWASAYSALS